MAAPDRRSPQQASLSYVRRSGPSEGESRRGHAPSRSTWRRPKSRSSRVPIVAGQSVSVAIITGIIQDREPHMPDNEKRAKPKYESPILVPLGEMARGSGVCGAGSAVAGGVPWGGTTTCTVGNCVGAIDPLVPDCTAGPTAHQDCTAGVNAGRDCSQGDCALRDCTAGITATDVTCAAGGAV